MINEEIHPPPNEPDPPAMGERRARWGYGYQDKVATERTLNFLRKDLRETSADFEGIRLADLEAGRVDDFVLVWCDRMEGNSIKWSADVTPFTWGGLIGSTGILRELAEGFTRLRSRWRGRKITVRLQSNRIASAEIHHAQLVSSISVAEFLKKYWALGPELTDSPDVADVWQKIAEHVGLSGSEFSTFVASCELSLGQSEPPGVGPDSVDSQHYVRQFDRLHKAIATWLTNAPHNDFIDRDYLLKAIGFETSRSDLIQRFPEPDIPYQKNQAAADHLQQLIEATPAGYLAVVGPAGIGKSTLVQDVLADSNNPFFVPYYAFLPNIEGNRDRAEALTFFQDVIDRLDRFDSSRLSLGINDLGQGRKELQRHMSQANKRYVLSGQKTVLLIDGLDHVMREAGLQASVLNELPHPADIPEGFLIILSGQPQAFLPNVIPAGVAAAVIGNSKRVDVSGLSRLEVHTLVSRITKPITGADRDTLYDASIGNPLILTYILGLFERSEGATVEAVVQLAGNYLGHIDHYYLERLSIPLQDSQTRRVLGLLCRAVPATHLKWLAEWPEKDVIDDLYKRVLAPYVRINDERIEFIHDSLIAFLRSETRSQLSGDDASAEEQKFYSMLADRAQGRSFIDPVGRARISHLIKAERYQEVLAQLSSGWVRSGVGVFLPFAHIHPVLLLGLMAACVTSEWGHVLRLILLGYELSQRTARVETTELADALLEIDKPLLAIAQIRSGGRLLVGESTALQFARSLSLYANRCDDANLKAMAREIYLQAKPIWLLCASEPIDMDHQQEDQKTLTAWTEAAPLFEQTELVAQEILGLKFTQRDVEHRSDSGIITSWLLYRAMSAALAAGREPQECQAFIAGIKAQTATTLHFLALLRLAETFPLTVSPDILREAFSKIKADRDVTLAYAWFMTRQCHEEDALDAVRRIEHIRFEVGSKHSLGFSDVTYSVRLRWLQEVLEVPEGIVPLATEETEAYARVERTARRLGELRGQVMKGQILKDLHNLFRSLLLFHNLPVLFGTVAQRNSYILQISKRAIYAQIAALAKAAGPSAVVVLRDVFLELINGPASSQFLPYHLRYFAQFFFEENVFSRDEAVEIGLASTSDAFDDDPSARQSACLEIAEFLHNVGDSDGLKNWLTRASEVSAGAGSHKDYHMAHLAEWLVRSINRVESIDLEVLDRFARVVDVAGGRGGADAAAKILQLLMQLSPARSVSLAFEWIDRGTLIVSDALESMIMGGAEAHADPELLNAIYSELQSLIAPGDTSVAAAAALDAFPRERKRDAVIELMSSVRTNALPSRRVEVARALQDAIRREGLTPLALTNGLRTGQDDSSSKSMLYTLASGEVQTMDEVAARLGDPIRQDMWNPNETDNKDFNWWVAIKKTRIKDRKHFDDLVARFPPPDYREVELLVQSSELALEAGDRCFARDLVEQAINSSVEGSWHRWYDGGQKVIVFRALKKLDASEGIRRARERFSVDLSAGKLSFSQVLSDVPEILDLLEVDWPAGATRDAIDDYLKQVLQANQQVAPHKALSTSVPSWSASQALCMFVADLLAFPVVDIGVAARRVIARYVAHGGGAVVSLLREKHCWNPIQVEHLLAALHVGLSGAAANIEGLRSWIESLNRSESLAVRSIAKRICEEHGWLWEDISTVPMQPVILLDRDPDEHRGESRVLGGDVTIAWELHRPLMRHLERDGFDLHELRSEFEHIYRTLETEYPWTDNERLQRWMHRVLARIWLNPRAILGREAAMRVFGRRALSGQVPLGAEAAYDQFSPIYDPRLELCQPMERPKEFAALDWDIFRAEQEEWLQGLNASEWSNYSLSVDGLQLIGERTWFIRPDWEWPREERYRGLVAEGKSDRHVLESTHELTYEMYAEGQGQGKHQLTVMNSERQLVGPAYRWVAINANFAAALGWHLSAKVPFQWLDDTGKMMVESRYWKDGWIWLEPPRFESLGEGWFIVASPDAVDAIRAFGVDLHLWVERHSHGQRSYQAKWHLVRSV